MICDNEGRRWPKHRAPFEERDCFVFFDESRCRGADMKLRSDDVAILTLSPRMCKDKLMQAAGRMRLLEMGQRLILVSPPDVSMQICTLLNIAASDIRPHHVLQWTMANTVSSTAYWLLEYAKQGGHHFLAKNAPERALLPDKANVQDLYEHRWGEEAVSVVWMGIAADLLRASSNMTDEPRRKKKKGAVALEAQLEKITEHMMKYGMGQKARILNFDEECEREAEKEIELEVEEECQVPRAEPRAETEWDWDKFLRCATAQSREIRKFTRLAEFMCTPVIALTAVRSNRPQTAGIEWCSTVYCSPNFLHTIKSFTVLNEYLRVVDHAVLLPGTGILLISQREANAMTILLQHNSCTYNAQLVHLCYLRHACDTPAAGSSAYLDVWLMQGHCMSQVLRSKFTHCGCRQPGYSKHCVSLRQWF